ncbi:MAG: pyridoxal phosphate-dependent decarboxylase family protein [Microthrixaceae bacterium]
MPEHGRDESEILDELRTMAAEEDGYWEGGHVSGSMYCGDHDHYAFLTQAFGLFAHSNALQRDICPSATRFEGEIIAMSLDMLHGDAVTDTTPGGLVTSGGSASIAHAVLSYREKARAEGRTGRLNVVKPETAHPAFDKACHLFDLELRRAPVDPETTQVDVGAMAALIDDDTIAIIGSACNYGYGTVDPMDRLSELALERGVGLHVDGCLGGFILPWGQELGYPVPTFDFRLPGVTTISADTHKYGYAFKGSSVVLFRDTELRNSQYFYLTDWTGGKYCSPSMDGSRSVGLLASTWASMVKNGREGYLRHAQAIFSTAAAMQDAVRSHGDLRILGLDPTFLFSFTSDDFDIYLVNDRMKLKGWRFNGQQYPNALHMAVTRPQTQPDVAVRFAEDLNEAVAWAREHRDDTPESGAVYGGVAGGMTDEADDFIKMVMADMMDQQLSLPD